MSPLKFAAPDMSPVCPALEHTIIRNTKVVKILGLLVSMTSPRSTLSHPHGSAWLVLARARFGTGGYFPPLQFTCRNCGGGDRSRVAIYRPFGEVSLSLNRTVTCMVLKANDRRTSCPCHDEFRGPRSDYV
ncbi:uncharacterized protein TNCV_1249461 [Trichonephila clavipes]|nr:uncharacterized protein TNCV_1249461 [Trichonephila clavipes]